MTGINRLFVTSTNDPREAFPDIQSLDLEVSQDPCGNYSHNKAMKSSRFTMDNLRPYIRCLNPQCQQGGLELQNLILFWPDGEETFRCNGHEGTPKGRRKGAPCDNYFKIKKKTVRKNQQ